MSNFNWQAYSPITLVVTDIASVEPGEMKCKCRVCGVTYIDYEWCHDPKCVDICNRCMYPYRMLRGFGFRPLWNYIGGGGRIPVATDSLHRQAEQLHVVTSMLEREIKCKSN